MNDEQPARIVRAPLQDNPYFLGVRSTPQNRKLSWEARGVIYYLLSKPDTWEVQPHDLEQECGRDKVRSILRELEDARHLKRVQLRDDQGLFLKNEYQFFEIPFTENPSADNPATANPPSREYREEETTEGKKDSLSEVAGATPTNAAPEPVALKAKELEPEKPKPEAIKLVGEHTFYQSSFYPVSTDQRVVVLQRVDKDEVLPAGFKSFQGVIVSTSLEIGNFKDFKVIAEFPAPKVAKPRAKKAKAEGPPAPRIDQCLKDEVARVIQGIDPDLGGTITGLIAQAMAGVWRKKLKKEKLTAEEYAAVSRSVKPFWAYFQRECPDCNLRDYRKVEDHYSRFVSTNGQTPSSGPQWVENPDISGTFITLAQLATLQREKAEMAHDQQ